MGNFEVELIREGRTVKRAEVQASSDVEAAKVWGPVTIPLGPEPKSGEWIRVTQEGVRSSWFAVQ